jgi:deazaflavin-dependent oxidoreductase (nitroreductase family)
VTGSSAAAFTPPSPVERLFNRLFGVVVGLGLGPRDYVLLQVRGRTTGRVRSTPVNVVEREGRRYLVAPRGRTQWVRNVEATGTVTLKVGRRRAAYRLRALADGDKPVVLRAYLERFRPFVQRYFPVPAGAPAEVFAPLAARYPVFELIPERTG